MVSQNFFSLIYGDKMVNFSKCAKCEYANHEVGPLQAMKAMPETITKLASMSDRLVESIDTGLSKAKDYANTVLDKVKEYCEQNSITGTIASIINNIVTNILHMLANPAVKTVAIAIASILMHLGILAATAIHTFSLIVEKVINGFVGLRTAATTTVRAMSGEVSAPEQATSEGPACSGERGVWQMCDGANRTTHALNMEDDCASMIGMLWSGSQVVTGISAKRPKDFNELVTYFKGQIPTATRDGFFIVRFFQAIMKTLIKIMHLLSETIFPEKVTLDSIFQDTDVVKLWVEEVITLTQPSNLDYIMTQAAWADRVFFASDLASYLLAKFTSLSDLPQSTYAPIRDLAMRIFKVRDRCHAGRITPSVYREPFCIWVFGEGGIGKSTFADNMIAEMLNKEAITWQGERDFVVNSSMTYANRARAGQPVWRFDDMMCTGSGIEFSVECFMGLKTGAPFNPRMARLEDKDLLVNPELIFVCSNLGFVDHLQEQVPQAYPFHRRRNMLVETRIKPNTVITQYSADQTSRGEQLQFCIYPNATDPTLVSKNKTWVDIDEFRRMACVRFHEWREKQLVLAHKRYMTNLSTMIVPDAKGLREKMMEESPDGAIDGMLKKISGFTAHHDMMSMANESDHTEYATLLMQFGDKLAQIQAYAQMWPSGLVEQELFCDNLKTMHAELRAIHDGLRVCWRKLGLDEGSDLPKRSECAFHENESSGVLNEGASTSEVGDSGIRRAETQEEDYESACQTVNAIIQLLAAKTTGDDQKDVEALTNALHVAMQTREALKPIGETEPAVPYIYPYCKGRKEVLCKYKVQSHVKDVDCLCVSIEKSASNLVTESLAAAGENRHEVGQCHHKSFHELVNYAAEKNWTDFFSTVAFDVETQSFYRGQGSFTGSADVIATKAAYVDARWRRGVFISSIPCTSITGRPAGCAFNDCEVLHRTHLRLRALCPHLYRAEVRPALYQGWMEKLKLEARSVWYRIKDAYAAVKKWCEDHLPSSVMWFLRVAGNILKVFGLVGGIIATGLGALFVAGKTTQWVTGSERMNDVYRSTVESIPLLGRARHELIASGDATKVARISSQGYAVRALHNSGLQNVAALACRIDTNTVFVYQYRGEQMIQYARCLILAQRDMLLLRHYVEAFKREEGEDVWYMLVTPLITVQWVPEWENVRWEPESGFGIMTLPSRVVPRRSIINFFASKAEHHKFGREATLVELGQFGVRRHDVLVRRTDVTAAGKKNDGTSAVYLPIAYAYGVHAEGMCGSLLIEGDRIYGMHVAGSSVTQSGYAEPLVRERFKAPKIVPEVDAADIKDCDDFPFLRNVLPLGYVRGEHIHHESGRTRIQPSLLWGKLNGDPKTAPGVLSPTDPRAKGASPLFLGVAKHGMVCKQLHPKRVREVQEWLQRRELIMLKPQRKVVGVLSFEESVLGIPGNVYYKGLDMSTSEGFPFTSMKPKGETGKQWLLRLKEKKGTMMIEYIDAKLLDEIDYKMRLRLQGVTPCTVWVDNLKDCRLPHEKCVPGKTRIFSTSPLDFTIVFRQMFMDYIAAMMGSRFDSMCAVGIACDGPEWTMLRNYLEVSPDWKVMGFDYSNFGPGLIEEVLTASFEDMRNWYRAKGDSAESDLVREVMTEEVCCAIHLMHKWLYQVCAGLPSGCPGTAILNSKVNMYYIAVAWLEIMANTEFGDMRSFEDNVRLVTYGDDLIMSVSPFVCERFNMLTIVSCLGKYDIKMSPPDKSSVVDKKWLDWTTVTFLKRGWRLRTADTWLAPIDVLSVWECPQWSWSTDEKILSTVVNCDAGCLLAYGHGKKFYDTYVDRIQLRLREQGVYYVPRSWHALDAMFFPSMIRAPGCEIIPPDIEYANHQMMSEERTVDPPMPCVTVDNRSFPPELFFGERVVLAKDALRRYEWYCILPKAAIGINKDPRGVMYSIPLRVQGIDETSKQTRFEQYVRTTFRSVYASGFVYFRGSLRVKFVNRAGGIFKVQHVYDARPKEDEVVEFVSAPIEIKNFFQAGYATAVQTCAVNEVVTIEVPYYFPSILGVVGPGVADGADHDRQYMSYGRLIIRVEDMEGPTEVYVSIADDFSFHSFQGFPPMLTLENEPLVKKLDEGESEQAEHQMLKAGPLIDEQAVGEVSAGNVCLQVGGETASSCPDIATNVYQQLSGQEATPIVEFESVLNRWVNIASIDWSIAHSRGTLLTTIDLIAVLRDGLSGISGGLPFKMFQYWSGDINLRFQMNSNAFQAGQLQVALVMLPSMRKCAELQSNIYSCSQRSHVIVSAGGTGEAELCIPYSYPQPYLPLRGKLWGLGKYHKVEVRVLSRLTGPSTMGTSCSMTCFMSIKNSTFTGMIPVTEIGVSEMIPPSIVAAMAGLSMMLPDNNRDKPPYPGAAEVMVPAANQSMCVGTNYVEPILSLRLDAKGQTPHPVTNEMEIDTVKRVWGLIGTFLIKSSNTVGYKLWSCEMNMSWKVNKSNYPIIETGTVNGDIAMLPSFAMPPCDVLQCMFGYGRGSWELRFDVVANHYQRCRIQVVVVPGPAIKNMDAARARASTHAVFDIEGSGQFEFTVPYIAPQPMWPRRFVGGNQDYDFDALGNVYVFLVNKLVNTNSAGSDVDVLVYKRAGVDYQYICMAQPSIAPAYNREFKLEATSRVRAIDGYWPWYVGVWRSFGNGKFAILRYGAGSDHVAQFQGGSKNCYYRLLWPSNKDIPQVKYNVKDKDGNLVAKSEDLEYGWLFVAGGYTYMAPLKAENVAINIKTYSKYSIDTMMAAMGYVSGVIDQGNEGLYDEKYGNVTWMALKIE
nr:polyprotein [Ischnura senegalensis iflavirus 2]